MTSKAIFQLDAVARTTMGKGASRRLRNNSNAVPAIVYGGNKAPVPITLAHNKVMQALEHEAFYSHLLTLMIDGKKEQVVLRALQRHHYKQHAVLHLDFQRVSATDKIHLRIPLHFTNAELAPGLKKGGIITHQLIDLDVKCLVSKLPEFIEVDLSNLELDSAVHVKDLVLPSGVEVHAKDLEQTVAALHLPRKAVEEESAIPVGAAPTIAEVEGKDKGDKGKK